MTSLLLISSCAASCPSDAEMEERLRTGEADFHRLIQMLNEDSYLIAVEPESAYQAWNAKANLPEGRMNEYRALLSKLNLRGVRRWDSGIYFKAWHRGFFPYGGITKYYVYAECTPNRIVDSLDKIIRSGQDANVYKRVSERWYLNVDIW